jgi:hypothetical protein
MRTIRSGNIAILIFAFALLSFGGCGCSCGGDDSFKKIDHRAARDYDADSDEEGFRKKSLMSSGTGSSKYYGGGIDLMKKREKKEIVEKLQVDGRKALKYPNFLEAEKLFSEGKYQEALKLYDTAGAAGRNIYIERRALACKVSIDRVQTRENEELKKVTSLLIDGRNSEAISLLENIEKQSASSKDNTYLKQSVSSLKIMAYDQASDGRKLIEEHIRQEKISEELSERLSRSWTVPIE